MRLKHASGFIYGKDAVVASDALVQPQRVAVFAGSIRDHTAIRTVYDTHTRLGDSFGYFGYL